MKLERKNFSPAVDTNVLLNQLERTMVASIAMMKRLRRETRRANRSSSSQVDKGETSCQQIGA